MSFIFEEPANETITFASGGIVDLGDMYTAAYRDARTSYAWNANVVAGELAADEMIEEVRDATGVTLDNPFRLSFYEMEIKPKLTPAAPDEAFGSTRARVREDAVEYFNTQYAALRRTDDGRQLPEGNLQDRMGALVRERRAIVEDTRRRARGSTALVGSLAGGVGAAFTDPSQVIVGLLPVGQSASVLRTAISGAVLSGATEAAMQPYIMQWHEDVGLDYTLGDAVKGTAFSALFGGLLSGGGQAGYRAIRGTPEFRSARQKLQALPEDHPMRQILSGKRSDVLAAAQKLEGLELDDAGRAALARVQADQAADDLRPDFVDGPAHRNAMRDADPEAALASAAEPTPAAPARTMSRPTAFTEGAKFEVNGKPVTQQRLDVTQLETDAALMQYKGGGDARGVTERLQSVRRWNPILAGEMIVYERLDGRRIVADGHQRSGLGRRLVQSGAEDEILVNSNLLREADGWTPADVRAEAAKKNIAEGSGDVLDTAQAIRDRPDIVDDSLPVGSDHMRQARAIARLSDKAYDLVRGGVLKPSHGAIIGRYAPRDMHEAVADAMVRVRPQSQIEAQVVMREALEAGARVEVQESLFGTEAFQRSLLPEKMKLVSAITAKLRSDKSLFSMLARDADRIEAAGNQLARDENAGRAQSAAEVEALLVALATKRGAVSTRLNEAAASITDGTLTRAKAAADLAASLRKSIEEGGVAKLLAEESPPPRVYDAADEGEDLMSGIDDRTADMFAPDRADDQAGRGLEDALNDPDLVAAVERQANESPTLAPDATFEDLQAAGRTYKLGDREGDVEAAVDHLTDVAKAAAGQEPGANRRVIIVTGLPGAGKSGVAERLARSERAALPDADQAKAVIPEYENGTGAGVVHKESVLLNTEVVARLLDEGTDMIFQTVGKTAASLDNRLRMFREAGYSVTMLRVNVDETEAARRMISRFKKTGRIVPPETMRQAARDIGPAWDAVNKEGISHGQIDISGPKGTFEAGVELPGDIQEVLTRAGLRPGEGRGGDVRQRDRTGSGTRESAATEEVADTANLFATVPGADGAPVRNAAADVDKADAIMKRFEGCIVR